MLGFQVDVIDGGANAAAATGAAGRAGDRSPGGMMITPEQFGRVAPAEALASGLGAARDGFLDLARQVQRAVHRPRVTRPFDRGRRRAAGHRHRPGRHGGNAPVTAQARSTGAHDRAGLFDRAGDMTAPAGVDLSLPSDQQLAAAAAPDPHAEAARLAAADPGRVGELGRAFADAGTGMDAVHRSGQLAQRRLAEGFHNNGAPVYDGAAHLAALPPGSRDSGTHLHALGRRLGAVSEELAATITDTDQELRRLQTDLDARRRSWAVELETLGGRDRLFPPEAMAGLLARRTTISAQMQDAVNACGRAVAGRIDRYAGPPERLPATARGVHLPAPERRHGGHHRHPARGGLATRRPTPTCGRPDDRAFASAARRSRSSRCPKGAGWKGPSARRRHRVGHRSRSTCRAPPPDVPHRPRSAPAGWPARCSHRRQPVGRAAGSEGSPDAGRRFRWPNRARRLPADCRRQ